MRVLFKNFPRAPAALLCAASLMFFATACGSLYKVKPAVSAPVNDAARGNEAGGLALRAAPLLTDEESQELFEANLPLAGLLPVRVEITNRGTDAIELKRARFRLRDAEGGEWKARSPKETVSRILSSDKVTLYNPQSRARFEAAISAYALDTRQPLAPSERRQGLIFFQTPRKQSVASPRALILSVERLSQPLEVQLN